MKYFNPSYWFKLWVLSAPLFNDKTQGINAKSIDNKNIKDWTSKNITNLDSINESLILSNNNKTYNLSETNININPIYKKELEPTTHKHQHEKNRNRGKRTLDGTNEAIAHFKYDSLIFVPEFWEEITALDWGSKNNFVEKLNDKIYTGDFSSWNYIYHGYGFPRWYSLISTSIYDNFWTIANKFIDSSRKERIEIMLKRDGTVLAVSWELLEVKIISDDSKYYPNKYLDNLKRDFPIWDSTNTINLGLINDNNDIDIKNAIKQKYPNLDFSQISIVDKIDYSHFCKCFKNKLYVSIAGKYSFGNLKPTFSYITQTKINEINDIIANNSKVKQWLEHVNDYNKKLPTKIEHLKTYTDSQKWTSKNAEKEIIKGYIRDWSIISTLIEHDQKLDELNKNVQGLKTDFDSIKNQVNDLDNRVKNLENTSNWNCANTATVTAGVVSVIPIIGTIGGAVATVSAGACAIAGV